MRCLRAINHALRQCKAEEDDMRAESLSCKLQNGNPVAFWQEVRSMTPRARVLPEVVDDAVGKDAITALWRDKFGTILNSVDNPESRNKVLERLTHWSHGQTVNRVTVRETQILVSKLKLNKAIGMDDIPNEMFKYAPTNILVHVSLFFNSFLVHCFLPAKLMQVLIIPLLKSKMKDPARSINYRPIAIATAASKLFEQIILDRVDTFLHSTENQFGFKAGHSTDMCIMMLKETIFISIMN